MCKALERGMEITELYLERKSGGQSGDYVSVHARKNSSSRKRSGSRRRGR
jgi:hypothetical protein